MLIAPARLAAAALMGLGTLVSTASAVAADALPLPDECPVETIPAERFDKGLVVLEPTLPPRIQGDKRLRTHVQDNKYWTGPRVPLRVPLAQGWKVLDVLDHHHGGKLSVALYRDRYARAFRMADEKRRTGKTPGLDWSNDAPEAHLVDCRGNTLAKLDLSDYFSRSDHLEVQDIRFDGDRTLFFNEACQTYSHQAGGRCSSLVAVDVITKKVRWRSAALRSNNAFLLHGDTIITGYGFTGEAGGLFVLNQSDGRQIGHRPLFRGVHPGNIHDALAIVGDTLHVGLYDAGEDLRFRLDGFDGSSPRLTLSGQVPQEKRERFKRPKLSAATKQAMEAFAAELAKRLGLPPPGSRPSTFGF